MSHGSQPPRPSSIPAHERRIYPRYAVSISVDYSSGDTFLFSYIENISEMGIFIRTTNPLTVGTELRLRFSPPDGASLELRGQVAWVNPMRLGADNPNPGMGVRFLELDADDREEIVNLVRTVAYLKTAVAQN